MKKMLSLCLAIVCIFLFSIPAQAHEIEFTNEETVYVNSEEEFLAYSRDMSTQYTFIIQPKTRATTQCSSCGGVATYYISKEQTNGYTYGCFNNPLAPDFVSVYERYRYTECTCGYLEKTFIDNSYTVSCFDTGITYAASYSTTVAMGYDIHQDMNFWD